MFERTTVRDAEYVSVVRGRFDLVVNDVTNRGADFD
jgi:hypothetical protein